MGNGACHQQVPSIDEVNLVARNFNQQFEPCNSQCTLPLLNSQSQSPSKPTIESKNPTIARLDEEEFEILMTNEDKYDDDLSPVKQSKLSRAQSPTKPIKSKHHYKQEEIYFLELLKQDKTNIKNRRKSADRQLSPVKVIHSNNQKKHNTALLIHSPDKKQNQLIKMNRLSCQLDEAVIIQLEPKSILKSIGSEKSLSNSQKSKTNSLKRVRFGMVYRQYK